MLTSTLFPLTGFHAFCGCVVFCYDYIAHLFHLVISCEHLGWFLNLASVNWAAVHLRVWIALTHAYFICSGCIWKVRWVSFPASEESNHSLPNGCVSWQSHQPCTNILVCSCQMRGYILPFCVSPSFSSVFPLLCQSFLACCSSICQLLLCLCFWGLT